MLSEAHQLTKSLTSQLKEEKSTYAELSALFSKASTDMESFKKSFNFRLNLAKSREQILLRDHFRKFSAAEIDLPMEVKQLKDLIELKE